VQLAVELATLLEAQLSGLHIELADHGDRFQPGSNRPLSVVFMGLWVTKVDEDAVAHVFRDKPIELADSRCDCTMILGDNLAIVFRIES